MARFNEIQPLLYVLAEQQAEAIQKKDAELLQHIALVLLILVEEGTRDAVAAITRSSIVSSSILDKLLPDFSSSQEIISIMDPQLRVIRLHEKQYKLKLSPDMWRTFELFFEGKNYKIDIHALIESGHFTNRSNAYNHISVISKALKKTGLKELGVDIVREQSDVGIFELVFPGKRYVTDIPVQKQQTVTPIIPQAEDVLEAPVIQEPEYTLIVSGRTVLDENHQVLFETNADQRMLLLQYFLRRVGQEIPRLEILRDFTLSESGFTSLKSRLLRELAQSKLGALVVFSTIERTNNMTKEGVTYDLLALTHPNRKILI